MPSFSIVWVLFQSWDLFIKIFLKVNVFIYQCYTIIVFCYSVIVCGYYWTALSPLQGYQISCPHVCLDWQIWKICHFFHFCFHRASSTCTWQTTQSTSTMRTLSGTKRWIKAARGPSAGSLSSCAATTMTWPNSGETFLYVGASQNHIYTHSLPFILFLHFLSYVWLLSFDPCGASVFLWFLPILLQPYHITYVTLLSLRQTFIRLTSHNIAATLGMPFQLYSFIFTLLSQAPDLSMCSPLSKWLHSTYFPFSSLSETLTLYWDVASLGACHLYSHSDPRINSLQCSRSLYTLFSYKPLAGCPESKQSMLVCQFFVFFLIRGS